jgi:hypothetical protein
VLEAKPNHSGDSKLLLLLLLAEPFLSQFEIFFNSDYLLRLRPLRYGILNAILPILLCVGISDRLIVKGDGDRQGLPGTIATLLRASCADCTVSECFYCVAESFFYFRTDRR